MQEISGVRINWMGGYGNDPRIIVEFTDHSGIEFPNKNSRAWINLGGIHVSQNPESAFCHYFYTDGKPTEGFGGRTFEGTFLDGQTFSYRGAWSCRAADVKDAIVSHNETRLDTIVDVECGYRFTAIREEMLIAWWRKQENPSFGLAFVDTGDVACILMPTRLDGSLKRKEGRKIRSVVTKRSFHFC